jgi:hypothetical protein
MVGRSADAAVADADRAALAVQATARVQKVRLQPRAHHRCRISNNAGIGTRSADEHGGARTIAMAFCR